MSVWDFYDRGMSLFPLHAQSKIPAGKWAQFMERRATGDELTQWMRGSFNAGVATGAISGIIVLDADDLMARVAIEERGIPATLAVRTPRGTHWYFAHPGWATSNKAGLQWPGWDRLGVDVRGDGGFVVAPGSYYVPSPADRMKGKVEGPYVIEQDLPIVPAPQWLLDLLAPKDATPVVPARMAEETSQYGRVALNAQLTVLSASQRGQVSDQIFVSTARIAELVAGGEITTEDGWGGLAEVLAALGLEDEAKAQGTVQRAWAKGESNPKCAPEREPKPTIEQVLGTRGSSSAVAPPPPPMVDLCRPFRPLVKPPFVGGNEVAAYFSGCVYIANRDQMFLPTGLLVGKSAFDGLYGGPQFVLDFEGSKKVRSAWEMFRQNGQVSMPMAWDICFRPELPAGQIVEIENLPFLNIYVPIITPRQTGDPTPFLAHVRKMLPDGQDADLLLHWMASCVQNPGAKFQWWPVVQGVKGNGKSLLLRVMFRAIGERYSHHVRADSLMKSGNQFNDWIVGKLFLGFEEIRSSEGRRDFVEIMKDTVTAERLATEGKGRGQSTSDNRANGMMLTNHDDACPIDEDERRWGVFFTAQQNDADMQRDGMTQPYFVALYDWLNTGGYEVVTHYLTTMPLEACLDPARGLQRAPKTSSTGNAIAESLGTLEQEVREAIESDHPGFRAGVVSSFALRLLFDRCRKTVGPKRYRKIMKAVGYVTHPALDTNKGRFNNALADMTKPVVYFAEGSAYLGMDDLKELQAAVELALAQGVAPGENVVNLRPPLPIKR